MKTTKNLNTSSASRCELNLNCETIEPTPKKRKCGQPIRELIERYGITEESAICAYYGWRTEKKTL